LFSINTPAFLVAFKRHVLPFNIFQGALGATQPCHDIFGAMAMPGTQTTSRHAPDLSQVIWQSVELHRTSDSECPTMGGGRGQPASTFDQVSSLAKMIYAILDV